ncbi:DNA polymerase III subunit gamma and tau [Specibacter sp. AOP5-B1-6]|uniref:DNA polymerase III subunit gamma and tau n=1 Tax=Specibacter sp. AOP5-B1-6 TaxID=3457653 RepID=UPI00402B64D9
MSAPTALYRRYRPDSFATVIGQEHVTAPLMAALEKNRVNHAYLFSGPRGCGKTTSARILARCLNCAKGPTSHPCGECDSCIELARGGAGSLDVIEIDAASHGGVDDARDLRERATFAPIRDRYKIFIIDEAHMVTSAGFNALLKIVEEPPEHIKFIFATTEPDKVIGTIRSRTHHYPFRLVPPEPLMGYLAQLCEQENVAVAPGVLSLVVRAGGGSVRDSLSVLDQLMAGAGASGLDYDLAIDLLGYTHASLLDDVVEALAATDSATVFKSVDKVVQTGHDPRRFVEDLLERFRDLIIVQAMPESAHAILRGTPDELIARMQTQAAQLGAAELSRAADVTNAAFNEMTGATSPRLHLELLGARLLLPGADSSVRGMATRLDQLERRLNYSGSQSAAPAGMPPAGAVQAGVPERAPEHTVAAQGSTSAPATAAAESSGGGLAAVRAQLARAKEAAGAEVAARHAPTAAPTQDSAQESAHESAATHQAPAAEQPRQPQTQQRQPEAQESPQQGGPAAAPAARTWDDLPTPAGDAAPAVQKWADQPSPATPQSGNQQTGGSQQNSPQPNALPATAPQNNVPQADQQQVPTQLPQQTGQPAPSAQAAPAAPSEPAGGPSSGSTGIEVIRRAWPEILGALRNIRMASWAMVNQNVVPQVFDGRELRVGLPSSGLIETFSNNGHLQNLQQAINQVLGMTVQILPADGEAPAPRASAEPNPKVQTGSPSQQREGGRSTVPQQANPASRQGQANPVHTPNQPAAQAPASSSAPATPTAAATSPADTKAADSTPAAPVAAAPAETKAPAVVSEPARGQNPAAIQSPWDGPSEPSEPWDEPHPDSYPPEDYAAAVPFESPAPQPAAEDRPAARDSSAEPSADQQTNSQQAPPPAYSPTKVSPISAWTTGWDLPPAEPVSAAPVEQEAPRRSALLAEQIAQQSGQRSGQQPDQPAPQDWGVSLGQTSRQDVADPGWGSMANAPDWAQDTQGSDTAPAAATTTETATHAPSAAHPESAEPGSTSSSATETTTAENGSFNAAAPGAPLGASSTYPTVATVTAPLSQSVPGAQSAPAAQAPDAEQRQEAPDMAGSSAEPVAAKLSMYQRLANSSEAQAARAQTPALAAQTPYVEDVPSPDDVTIEESGVVGQAAVERILGGVLIEERPLNPSH